jgi:hypothetical protein
MTEQPYNPFPQPSPQPADSPTLQEQLDAANARIAALTEAGLPPAPGPEPAPPQDELAQLRERLANAEATIEQLSGKVTTLVVRKMPQHWLHLADGQVLESEGAVPTHVAVGDKVVPVVRAYER